MTDGGPAHPEDDAGRPDKRLLIRCASCGKRNAIAAARVLDDPTCESCGAVLLPDADNAPPSVPPPAEHEERQDSGGFSPSAALVALRDDERRKLESSVRTGSGWFYWIAGLSLLNTVAAMLDWRWSFAVGLGITQLFDAIGEHIGPRATMVARLFDGAVAAAFVAFGILARGRRQWAFALGLAIYALDSLVFLLVKDVIGIGLHAIGCFGIAMGWRSLRKLVALDRPEAIRSEVWPGAPSPPGPAPGRRGSMFGG